MPYVLQNVTSGELYACMQVNHYDLGYYGVKAWDSQQSAEADCAQWLGDDSLTGDWQAVHVEERILKLSNVKLKNNPAYAVLLSGESLQAIRRDAID